MNTESACLGPKNVSVTIFLSFIHSFTYFIIHLFNFDEGRNVVLLFHMKTHVTENYYNHNFT